MFKPIEGGSTITVGEDDLAIQMYLPPIGMVWNHEINQLEPCEVIIRSSVKEEQFWERPSKPDRYEQKSKREKLLQKNDPEFSDPELHSYRAREWHRRKFGVWFMNDGEYIYLTGTYYFYLGHWNIDIGAPSFKISDLHMFYTWDYCVQDPNCYGLLNLTKRRSGKSFTGASMLYEYVSRTANAHAGIQSKTRGDALVVFSEKLIQPWRKLVDFFRPEFDRSQGDVPKSSLRFFKTAKKGAGTEEEYDAGGELESWIDFGASDEIFYDGQKMLRYMCDEVFKTTETNIIKRHEVVRPCLEDTSGSVIGKAIYTSTVEDMEGYLELYVKLWEDSDFSKKNKNGKTKSGLYRYFTPAQNTMYVDKYGRPDIQRALTQIENEIAEKQEDPRELSAYLRKNPRNWKEAFRATGGDCIYDAMKLDDRLSTLTFQKEENLYKTYSLTWDEDVEDGEVPRVILNENKNGRFKFSWNFADMDHANDVSRKGSSFYPKNSTRFVIGIDPFDHNRTRSGGFSSGAACVFMKYDPLDSESSDTIVATYLGRPQSAAIFYEDMIKLCHYFSCSMLFEDNKPNIQNYFSDRGYGAFMMRDEKGRVGIPATDKTHQAMAEATESFINENIRKVNFPRLIKDWLEFDLDDTTKFDLAMAAGYALIAAGKMKRRSDRLSKLTKVQPTQFVRKFKIKNKARYGNSPSRKLSKSLR